MLSFSFFLLLKQLSKELAPNFKIGYDSFKWRAKWNSSDSVVTLDPVAMILSYGIHFSFPVPTPRCIWKKREKALLLLPLDETKLNALSLLFLSILK